jgi:predicted phosphodiesterase
VAGPLLASRVAAGQQYAVSARRLAVVSDVHGNLAALRAVVEELRARPVDEVLLGGDLVQGGRQPAETLDLIDELGWPAVLGNADLAVLETAESAPLSSPEGADALLVRGLRWTAERLRPEQLARLRALPRALRRPGDGGGDFVLVHATPWSVEDVVRPDAPEATARRMLTEARSGVLAYGHIHHAYRRRLPEGLLASVGAVSGSNDRDPRPAYTVFTLGATVEAATHRVAYDAAAEAEALRESGYPVRPGRLEQLVAGGDWPIRA